MRQQHGSGMLNNAGGYGLAGTGIGHVGRCVDGCIAASTLHSFLSVLRSISQQYSVSFAATASGISFDDVPEGCPHPSSNTTNHASRACHCCSAASEDLMQRLGQDMFNPMAPYQSQPSAAAMPPPLPANFPGIHRFHVSSGSAACSWPAVRHANAAAVLSYRA